MPNRPKPTVQLIQEIVGGDRGLIESFHHGLVETPSLKEIYPVLDFDELVAFAASFWKSRLPGNRSGHFSYAVHEGEIYDLFNEVYRIGMPWLNKHKLVSDAQRELHRSVNPFGGRALKERLGSVGKEEDFKLRQDLCGETQEYVFECQYRNRKMARGGDNKGLVVMGFQNAYPKRGRIVPAFASEIGRIMNGYPTEFKQE